MAFTQDISQGLISAETFQPRHGHAGLILQTSSAHPIVLAIKVTGAQGRKAEGLSPPQAAFAALPSVRQGCWGAPFGEHRQSRKEATPLVVQLV